MPSRSLFLLSLLVGLAACDRQPTAPVGLDTPAFDWTNNSDNGNVRIMRFQDGFIACWSDATNGLRACHATFPLGDGTETDCGPQGELDPVGHQQVGLIDPDDFFSSWLHDNAKGKVWITVRDETQPGTCFDNQLVAEGWGNVHATDNDLFGTTETDHNTNAFGIRGNGRLTTPEGATVQYSGHTHARFGNAQGFKEIPPLVQVH
jgi:hypothetical protein